MIVLDTNVTSELMKSAPSTMVAWWVSSHSATELYTTSSRSRRSTTAFSGCPTVIAKIYCRPPRSRFFSAFTEHVLTFDAAAAK